MHESNPLPRAVRPRKKGSLPTLLILASGASRLISYTDAFLMWSIFSRLTHFDLLDYAPARTAPVSQRSKHFAASTAAPLFTSSHQHIKESHPSTSRWRPGGSETPTETFLPRHDLQKALFGQAYFPPASKEVSRYCATAKNSKVGLGCVLSVEVALSDRGLAWRFTEPLGLDVTSSFLCCAQTKKPARKESIDAWFSLEYVRRIDERFERPRWKPTLSLVGKNPTNRLLNTSLPSFLEREAKLQRTRKERMIKQNGTINKGRTPTIVIRTDLPGVSGSTGQEVLQGIPKLRDISCIKIYGGHTNSTSF
ncbi:hypothetical protein HAX54_040826 [Datura stramonium]|uniref:Uncharacterized protein n=1 Tax=Datura stramonium TaxID=4076 RepID=A0ABS8VN73_DATST|nr:hypothetical protein [Datura stramonium]